VTRPGVRQVPAPGRTAAKVEAMTAVLLLTLPSPDWRQMFVPSVSPLELVIRGSIMYLAILAAMRIFRRQTGSLNMADLLVVVLVADAAQNGMSSDYKSVTDGLVLVGTIYAWNYLLDAAAFRWRPIHRMLNPPPLPLVRDGQVLRRNLRQEMLTLDDLMEQLREQGVERLSEVRSCCLEGDGHLSVIRKKDGDEAEAGGRSRKQTSGQG
jgi:uncharacterized membrane protein YcaP (DUF421 family)